MGQMAREFAKAGGAASLGAWPEGQQSSTHTMLLLIHSMDFTTYSLKNGFIALDSRDEPG